MPCWISRILLRKRPSAAIDWRYTDEYEAQLADDLLGGFDSLLHFGPAG